MNGLCFCSMYMETRTQLISFLQQTNGYCCRRALDPRIDYFYTILTTFEPPQHIFYTDQSFVHPSLSLSPQNICQKMQIQQPSLALNYDRMFLVFFSELVGYQACIAAIPARGARLERHKYKAHLLPVTPLESRVYKISLRVLLGSFW